MLEFAPSLNENKNFHRPPPEPYSNKLPGLWTSESIPWCFIYCPVHLSRTHECDLELVFHMQMHGDFLHH